MTRLLCAAHAYLREFDAEVVEQRDGALVLDQTAFYPTGGGQPHDTGSLTAGDRRWRVVEVKKQGPDVLHVVEGGPPAVGTRVHASTREIGRIRVTRTENKGKINKRLEIALEPA